MGITIVDMLDLAMFAGIVPVRTVAGAPPAAGGGGGLLPFAGTAPWTVMGFAPGAEVVTVALGAANATATQTQIRRIVNLYMVGT